MSHYTTELRFICEKFAGLDESVGYNDVNRIIENSRSRLFNFDFPIYDETYRSVLETKIIKHYYTQEIGFETVGLFQHKLDMRMNEIMPYYNELYESAALEFNPLYDVDITETHEGSGEKTDRGTETKQDTENRTLNREDESEKNRTLDSQRTTDDDTTTSGTGSNTNYNLYSQTPQGGLSGVNNEEYLTDARKITDASNYSETNSRDIAETGSDTEAITDNTTSSETEGITKTGSKNITDNVTTTDEYIRTIRGKRGSASYAKMIMEYRKTLLNIDMMIIKELANLFMLIW